VKAVKAILALPCQVAGLFFDDGRLAIAVLVVLDLTATVVYAGFLEGPAAIALLVGGVVAVLLENVVRAAHRPIPG
jgi:hypothetical protein